MKRALLTLIAPLFLTAMPVLAATVVESNITIALKFYINDKPDVDGPPTDSLAYSTVSIKNADLLHAWSAANSVTLSKKARLMRRDYVNSYGEVDYEDYDIFIRDGEDDYSLPGGLDILLNEVVDKYRYNTVKGTGTYNSLSYVNVNVRIIWDLLDGQEGDEIDDDTIFSAGLEKYASRTVTYGQVLTSLDTSTTTVVGEAFFYTSNRRSWEDGVVQGTIKQSGPKVRGLLQ